MTINKLAQNIGLEIEDFIEIFEIYMDATTADMQELKAALKAGDPQGASLKAHSIKGASVNLVKGLSERVRKIEHDTVLTQDIIFDYLKSGKFSLIPLSIFCQKVLLTIPQASTLTQKSI